MWEIISYLFLYVVLPAAAAYGLSLLFPIKQEKPEPGKQSITLPTATEGRPFPVLFGCRMIRGVNAISPMLYRHTYYNSTKDTAANLYYCSFVLGVCLCLDGIKQIWWGGRCAKPYKDPDTFLADGETLIQMPAAFLWGDWAYGGPGGVDGTVDVCYGEDDQTLNAYIASKLGSDQPYNRGFVSMVFRGPTIFYNHQTSSGGCYIGTSPILRAIAILGKRTDQFCDHTDMWYSSKAAIGTYNDMNPAHIIYELMTSSLIGSGIDVLLIGDTFTTSADTLYTEGYGLSCVWDYAPDDIDSMVQTIEQIVDGKVYYDYDTGKFEFGLNRDDYTPANLETFDESDFWMESAGYLSPGRLPSKVIVKWEHRQYEGERLAYDDDIALLAKQGGSVNVQEYDYSGFVVDGDLANTIAARQQYVFSSLPKKFTLRCLRTMAHLHETDVFKISYPALNIGSMIVRLVSIDRGSLTNGEVIIECIEDVFGMSYTIYGTPPEPAIEPADLESNIAADDIDLTDYVNINIANNIQVYESLTVDDYGNISPEIYVDDDLTLEDYSSQTIA